MTGSGTGLHTAIVTSIADPEKVGRVQIRLPWLPGDRSGEEGGITIWARVMAPGAGKDRGLVTMPEIGDEVLIGFEGGAVDRPIVLGGLWSAALTPPQDIADGEGAARSLVSKAGHQVRLVDIEGEEKIEITSKDKAVSLVMDCASQAITITADKDITMESTSGKVTIKGNEVAIEASGETTVKGSKVKLN